MRKIIRSAALVPLIAAFAVAGPPSGGHASGGAGMAGHAGGYAIHSGPPGLSGPTPLGATGTAPIGAAGSLRPAYGYNNGTHSGYNGAGYHGGGYNGGGYNGYNNGGNDGHWGYGHNNRGNWSNKSRYPYAYYPGAFAAPIYGYGYDDSYFDNGYAPGPGPDYGPDPQGVAQEALGEQVQHLSAEIEDLRNQQQQQQAAPMMPPIAAPSTQSPPETDTAQSEVPITLVLHSGQQLQVKNYAVTDGVFWDFSKHPAQKIPVSSIDVAASQKATAAKGADFPPIAH